jgi:hypothetical protein
MKRGDFVEIECDGEKKKAMIVLASDNAVSLMVMFNGMFCGYVGMMALLRQDGVYVDLYQHKPMKVEKINERR